MTEPRKLGMTTKSSIFDAEKKYLEENGLLEEAKDVLEKIQQPRFSMKDVGLTSLTVHLWEKEKILFGKHTPQKQRKFNLTEVVWLKIISKLRDFNLPLPTIAIVKGNLDQTIGFEDVADEPSILEIMLQVTRSHGIEDDEVYKLLKSDDVKLVKTGSNFLEIAICHILMLRSQFDLLVNCKGEAVITRTALRNDFLENDPDFVDFLRSPHICLSITKILSEVTIDVKPSTFSEENIGTLSKVEQQILERCSDQDIELITIKYAKGKPFVLEVTHDSEVDISKRIADLIYRHPFQSITFNVQGGKVDRFKTTVRYKLDS